MKISFSREFALAQGDHRAQGVVLRRRERAGQSQDLLLFLTSYGATWASAPGLSGSKNRFGAGTEPMMWGEFLLYRSPRRLYLKDIDVREDFWSLRRSRGALRTALGWCGELSSRLMPGAMSDNLLSLLWGSMKNLSKGLDSLLLDVRFAWRWGNLWGVAPSLDSCSYCGGALSRGDGLVNRTPDGLLCENCFNGAAEASVKDRTNCQPIPRSALPTLRRAATLPRDSFAAWAAGERTFDAGEIEDCPSWLYSFLK
jgi:DNA repair protein RecO (recombination protein O)